MQIGGLGALVIALGVIAIMAAYHIAFKMTRDKPTGRIAALIAATSVSLLIVGITFVFTRQLTGEPARPIVQPSDGAPR